VTRTCISEIQINYFMVDQVCMSESNRRGYLCFCNDSLCNKSATITSSSNSAIYLGLFLNLVAMIYYNQYISYSSILLKTHHPTSQSISDDGKVIASSWKYLERNTIGFNRYTNVSICNKNNPECEFSPRTRAKSTYFDFNTLNSILFR